MLKPLPLDLKALLRYPLTIDDYFKKCRELDGTDCYDGDEELPWSFWDDDIDHLHPEVGCEILPRAWENRDDVLTTVHDEGGKHECYSYMLRSCLTRLLYIIEISENMGIERITQYEDDTQAAIVWRSLCAIEDSDDL